MTKSDSTTKHIFKSNVCHTRQLKVRAKSKKSTHPIGQIELKGQWLTQAGFTIDSRVTVKVMAQCIVLSPTHQRPNILIEFSQLIPANQRFIRASIETLNKKVE